MQDKPFTCDQPGCRYKSFPTIKRLHHHLGKAHHVLHPTVKVARDRFCKRCGVGIKRYKRLCDACRMKAHVDGKKKENERRREERRKKNEDQSKDPSAASRARTSRATP